MSVLSNLNILVNEVRDIVIKEGFLGGSLGTYLDGLEDSKIKFIYYHFKQDGFGCMLLQKKLFNCLDYQFSKRNLLKDRLDDKEIKKKD